MGHPTYRAWEWKIIFLLVYNRQDVLGKCLESYRPGRKGSTRKGFCQEGVLLRRGLARKGSCSEAVPPGRDPAQKGFCQERFLPRLYCAQMGSCPEGVPPERNVHQYARAFKCNYQFYNTYLWATLCNSCGSRAWKIQAHKAIHPTYV